MSSTPVTQTYNQSIECHKEDITQILNPTKDNGNRIARRLTYTKDGKIMYTKSNMFQSI